MNHQRQRNLVSHLFLSLCLLLVFTWQPAPAITEASTPASKLPDPPVASLPAGAQPTVIDTQIFTAIAAGGYHTCGLLSNRGVRCWGENRVGGLGDGTITNRSAPVDVVGLASGVTAIAVGGLHACALLSSGGVKCWGANFSGELGDGTLTNRYTPVDVIGLTSGVIAIATGDTHTCALLSSGGLKCWGYNGNGQLGDGTLSRRTTPVDVSGLTSGVTAVAGSVYHTCALLTGGGVKCWGLNQYGQLGDGTTSDHPTPVNVSGLAGSVTRIATGQSHTCALLSSGGVQCWGYNGYGQLGDGSTTNRWAPVDVSGLAGNVSRIATGQYHTCALLSSGGVTCWGYNSDGQLGDSTTTDQSTPVSVIGLAGNVTAITTGAVHTCALISGGGAMCWGNNAFGSLGDGTLLFSTIPLDVSGLAAGVAILATGQRHTCTVLTDGEVKCWGSNWSGQIGDGTSENVRSSPVDVSGLAGSVIAIAAGGSHTCALLTSHGVKCWGYNLSGQLGDGTKVDHSLPADVSGLASGVTAIAAGDIHTCALLASGGVKCWGNNQYGQLGDDLHSEGLTPVDVFGLATGVTAIATGDSHTCALLASGGVKCWGYNLYGQLGDGTTTNRYTAVEVSGLASKVVAIAAGGEYTCALLSTGGVQCWGADGFGQLGDGATTNQSTPVNVSGLAGGVIAIDAGYEHTCALLSGGGVKCWGWNEYGQLGDGTSNNYHSTPVDVSGLTDNVTALATGNGHTCALVTAGRLKCWGSDDSGQLGLGRTTQWLTPVEVIELVPSLTLNYISGQPGSFFTLTGVGFPRETQLSLSINAQALTPNFQVNPSGNFISFLNTTGASAGSYTITVSGYATLSASFSLAEGDALQPQEGGGLTFFVPTSFAFHNFVFLPVLVK